MWKIFNVPIVSEIILVLAVVLLTGVCGNSVKGYVTFKDPVNNQVVIDTVPSLKLEKIGERLYYLGAIFKGNWFQAIQFCNYHDMTLVSVETKEENDFIRQSLKTHFGWGEYHFWTSGTRLPADYWVWLSTGKPIIFANWSSNQPDNAGKNEKCLEVIYSNIFEALMWNDHVCTMEKFVICEATVPKIEAKLITNTNNCNLTLINVPAE